MPKTDGPNRSSVPINAQVPIQVTTKQLIVNIISDQVREELSTMFECQGLYITENPYVSNLVKAKIKGIFNDTAISGHVLADSLTFNARVMKGHHEGGNLDIGGINPEYRDIGNFVVDEDTELHIFDGTKT